MVITIDCVAWRSLFVLALLIGFGVERYNNQDRRNYDRLNDDEVNCTSMQSIIAQDSYSFLGRLKDTQPGTRHLRCVPSSSLWNITVHAHISEPIKLTLTKYVLAV